MYRSLVLATKTPAIINTSKNITIYNGDRKNVHSPFSVFSLYERKLDRYQRKIHSPWSVFSLHDKKRHNK